VKESIPIQSAASSQMMYRKVVCRLDLPYQTERHPQGEFSSISENIPTCCKCSFPFAFPFLRFKNSVILKSHFSYPWNSVRDRHSKGKPPAFPEETEVFLQGGSGRAHSSTPSRLPQRAFLAHRPAMPRPEPAVVSTSFLDPKLTQLFC